MSDCLPPALFRLLLTRLFVMGRPGVAISALPRWFHQRPETYRASTSGSDGFRLV